MQIFKILDKIVKTFFIIYGIGLLICMCPMLLVLFPLYVVVSFAQK